MLVTPSHKSGNRWFESLSRLPAPVLRVFCFPYAGGNAQVFRPFQRNFPPEIDICLVHLPGRGTRISEPRFTRVQPLVETLADAIQAKLQAPFALYGHSMGALISFELARELRRRNCPAPVHLFVSGRRAPSVPETDPKIFDVPFEELMDYVGKLQGTPIELFNDPEIRDLFVPLLRADFEIVDMYEYVAEPPLACPITVYGGLEDGHVPVASLEEWQKETSGKCQVRMLPGNHFFIHNQQMEFIKILKDDVLRASSVK